MARGTLEFINIVPYAVLFTGITYGATKLAGTYSPALSAQAGKIAATVGAMGIVVPNIINLLELQF